MQHQIETADAARTYLAAGNAVVTVVSRRTGRRYTYKVTAPGGRKRRYDADVRHVAVLDGPSNEGDYAYLGVLVHGDGRYVHARKSPMDPRAGSSVAMRWLVRVLWGDSDTADRHLGESVEVWHEGRCGRCGRRLTVPASIASGLGPECATKGPGR